MNNLEFKMSEEDFEPITRAQQRQFELDCALCKFIGDCLVFGSLAIIAVIAVSL